jgi:hypothetical protein
VEWPIAAIPSRGIAKRREMVADWGWSFAVVFACIWSMTFAKSAAMSRCRRSKIHRLIFSPAVALVASLFAVGPSLAASKQPHGQPKAESQEKAARKACLNGDYAEGVAILSNLFVETKNTNYIFNQGRCFEQNRRYEDAIARFQEFLRAGRGKLSASDKTEAEQHVVDCKQMLAQERASAPGQTAPEPFAAPPPSAALPPEPAPTPEPSPIIRQPAVQPGSPSGGAGLRIGGVLVASFGVAAVGAGVLFNVKANSMVDDMYASLDGYSKESNRKTYETLAWVGYGVGAACVVSGVLLYTFGLKAKSRQSGSVALVPTVGADHAGAILTGAF